MNFDITSRAKTRKEDLEVGAPYARAHTYISFINYINKIGTTNQVWKLGDFAYGPCYLSSCDPIDRTY